MTKFETICREASRLYARNGVEAVSMRDVADACDITVAALYYHFSSKEDLYEEVVQLQFDTFLRQLREGRDALPPGEETPSRVLALVLDIVLADPTLFLLTQRDLHRGDQGERHVHSRAHFDQAKAFLRETLERHRGGPVEERDVFALGCIVTGYCEYVRADARAYGPGSEAFIADQRETMMRVVRCAFEGGR